MSDPVTTMINEASTGEEWMQAAALVQARVRTGQADAGLIHHLMVKGWRVLNDWQGGSPMSRRMVEVLDEAVGQST